VASLFGISDSDLEMGGVGDSMADVLQKWGNKVQDALRKSLSDNTSKGTSKELEQSIKALPVQFNDQTWTLQFTAADYWKYINEGVGGAGKNVAIDGSTTKKSWANKAPQSPFHFTNKKPPVNFSSLSGGSLRQWAYNKGLNEYAVRESIFRKGIKATHFFDKVINQDLVKGLVKELEKAGAKEVEIVLAKGFKAIIK